MASASTFSPSPHPDPSLELAALRAKCNRLQTERDKFKEALWTLRGNFSALQTHAETLELENGDLKDVLSMRGEIWGRHGAIAVSPSQERLRSPSVAISDIAAFQSATLHPAPLPEPTEQPVSTLPKPIMRMQQFVEGSSPSPAALTVGSMGPPPSPSPSPRSALQFQQGLLAPEGSHSPNLPRSRTLAPVGSPAAYKKSGNASGKRKTAARPKSASVGSSSAKQTRSTKRSLEEETPSTGTGHTPPKKPRTESAPQSFRSVALPLEDTDSTLRAQFDFVIAPPASSISAQSGAPPPADAGSSPGQSQAAEALLKGANLSRPARYTPEPQFLSPVQQASPEPIREEEEEEDLMPEGHEQENAMQVVPESHPPEGGAGAELGAGEPQPLLEKDDILAPTGEIVPITPPPSQEKGMEAEAEPIPNTPHEPIALASLPEPIPDTNVSDTDTHSEITVKPRAPAPAPASEPAQTSAHPSASSTSPAPSTTSTRVTRSSRSRSEDLLNAKTRRAQTSWDPITGQRIRVGPPKGKPKSIQAASTAVKKEPKESKKLVISIRPRVVRGASAKRK